MPKRKALVFGPKNNPQLRHLDALSEHMEFVVSDTVDGFGAALEEAEAALIWTPDLISINRILAEAKKLRWMHFRFAGVDGMLSPQIQASSVFLTNARGVYAPSLAEFVMTGILYFAKDLPRMARNKAAKKWEVFDVDEIRHQTISIFGYGEIGRECAARAKGFGMKVLAYRRNAARSNNDPLVDEVITAEKKERLFSEADYFVVTAPLTTETKGAIGKAELAMLKPNAVLINIGRGAVLDEAALIEALKSKKIRGAVLDVYETEPLPQNSPLWELENVIISPHTADHTANWLDDTMKFFVGNCKRYVRGEALENVVDKKAGY